MRSFSRPLCKLCNCGNVDGTQLGFCGTAWYLPNSEDSEEVSKRAKAPRLKCYAQKLEGVWSRRLRAAGQDDVGLQCLAECLDHAGCGIPGM